MAAINILHDDENTTRHSSLSRSVHRKTQNHITSKVFQSQSSDVSATPRRALGDVSNLKHNKTNNGKEPISAKKQIKSVKTNDASSKMKQVLLPSLNLKPKGSISVLDDDVFSGKAKHEVTSAKPSTSVNYAPLEKEIMHPYVEEEEELGMLDCVKVLVANKHSLRGLGTHRTPMRQIKPFSFTIDEFIKKNEQPETTVTKRKLELPLHKTIFDDRNMDNLNEYFPLDPIDNEPVTLTNHKFE